MSQHNLPPQIYFGLPDSASATREVQESIQDTQKAVNAARDIVVNRRNAKTRYMTEVFGEGLGNMYDGDREAAQKMQQYIEYQYDQGLYNSDPSKFSQIVADYNAHIELFQTHYKNTYGTSTATGKGTTYLDIQARQALNNSNEFWEDTGNQVVGNEFDQAQETLNQLNSSIAGLDYDEEMGTFVATDSVTGEKVALAQSSQYQLGNKAFVPELEKLTPASFYDLSTDATTSNQVKLRMTTLDAEGNQVTNEAAAGLVFDQRTGLANPEAPKTKAQEDYRRALAVAFNASLGLDFSEEQIEAFATGNIDALADRADDFRIIEQKAREQFIDLNRFGVEAQPVETPKDVDPFPMISTTTRDVSVSTGNVPTSGDVQVFDVIVPAFELDKPIKQDATGVTGEYVITHVLAGPDGSLYAQIRVPETIENEPGEFEEIERAMTINIQGDDLRSAEIRRNLTAIGIPTDSPLWSTLIQNAQQRLDAANQRAQEEFEAQQNAALVEELQQEVEPQEEEDQSLLDRALGVFDLSRFFNR
tara:strand:+ start:430 stop:2025 length:1596 start_codon:yes stop_codon:yes gene_type:complete